MSQGNQLMLTATAVMASGTMISRILGLVRAMLIAFVLGNGTLRVEVFTFAMTVPNSLYILLAGGTLNNVLVPQIVRAVVSDEDHGKAFLDRIITGFLILLGALTAILTLATPAVMSLYTTATWRSPEMAEQWQSLLMMSYITMPQLFFYGVFFLIGQVLNAREIFGPMMWAPIVNNVVSIAVFGIYLSVWGTSTAVGQPFTSGQIWLLGVGSTLGIAIQTLALLPYLKRAGISYRPRFDLKGTGLGRTFHVAKWMVGYVALTSLAQVVVSNLASTATSISASGGGQGAGWNAYQNAYLIWILPHSLLTVSLATAMLPTASRFAAGGDLSGVAGETNRAVRLAATFVLPAAVGLGVLADPITRLIFGNGTGADDYHFVAWALIAFSIGLIPYTLQYLYLRAFYALDNTRTPFNLQIWISGANAALAVALILPWTSPGTVAARLALAYSLSYVLGALITHRSLRKRLPDLAGVEIWQHLARLALATLPAALLAWGITWWSSGLPGVVLRGLGLALAGVVAVAVFFLAAKRLAVPEAGQLVGVLRRVRPATGEEDAVEAIVDQTQASISGEEAGAPDPMPTNPGGHQGGPQTAGPEADEGLRTLSGRYRLLQQLPIAVDGEAWRAHDLVLDRTVLVQLLDADAPRTPVRLQLARIPALSTDTRFFRVLDVVNEANFFEEPYLVFEYPMGQRLDEVLAGKPLTANESALVAREVADALASLHATGHFHHKLSPSTVWLATSGHVKIEAFNIDEPAPLDETSAEPDVKAIGELLYACLTAHWPGAGKSNLPPAPTRDASPVPPAELNQGVSPEVAHVVEQILLTTLDSPERLTNAHEVAVALTAILGTHRPGRGLRARLNASSSASPQSVPIPPVPTPVAERFQVSSPVGEDSGRQFLAGALDQPPGFTPVPPPATPAKRRRGWLFGGLGSLVAIGLLVGVLAGRPPAQTASTSTGVLEIAKATDFDPRSDGGNGRENPGATKLAIDQDAKTAWRTERYRTLPNLGGIKPGVGVVLDLQTPRTVTEVVLTTIGEGTDVEVRVPDEPGELAPTRSHQQWRKIAAASQVGEEVRLPLAPAQQTRFVLIYFTSLPKVDKALYQGGLAEVQVIGH